MSDEEKSIRHSAQELKQDFINQAFPLVQQYIDAALGKGDFTSINAGAREEVWEVLKRMMLTASDKLEIDIKTAEDVIDAVTSGKCTFEEGEQLLTLYQKVKDIETKGQVGDGQGGVQIIIGQLSSPQPQEVNAIEHKTEAGHILVEGGILREPIEQQK